MKRKRLIDTVLRNWSIPAVHFIVQQDQTLAVLDGQQRLRSLYEFTQGELSVGSFLPTTEAVESLQGLRFFELPLDVQRRIMNYKVPSYRLYDYTPDEPHELFFRLNLPTGLTQAEKRNALMGHSRDQVKDLTRFAVAEGWSKESVGFENARLAYDDVIARFCLYLDKASLRVPVSTARMEEQFRSTEGFRADTVERARVSIEQLAMALKYRTPSVRPNKATLLSWLLVAARIVNLHPITVDLTELIEFVEGNRRKDSAQISSDKGKGEVLAAYLRLFDDRASLRVTDVMSVLARDAAIWRIACLLSPHLLNSDEGLLGLASQLKPAEEDLRSFEAMVLEALETPSSWGRI